MPVIHTHQGPPPVDEALPEVTQLLEADNDGIQAKVQQQPSMQKEQRVAEQQKEQSAESAADSQKTDSSKHCHVVFCTVMILPHTLLSYL